MFHDKETRVVEAALFIAAPLSVVIAIVAAGFSMF